MTRQRQMTDLQKLAHDIYNDSVVPTNKFSNKREAEETIRNLVVGKMYDANGNFDYIQYERHKLDLFEIIRQVVDIEIETILEKQFDTFVEINNVNLGDTIEFYINDKKLFRVGRISAGMTDIRRERLDRGKFTVSVEKCAVAIYAEWDRFLSGRIDFNEMINRVALSMSNYVGTKIYNTIYQSFDEGKTDLNVKGALDLEILRKMIAIVEGRTGRTASIYGTKVALGKVSQAMAHNPAIMPEQAKDRFFKFGYFGSFEGTPMYMIPQAMKKPNSNVFAIDNDFILVVPANEKLVKMVIEGKSEVYDNQRQDDQQIEYFVAKRFGVGIVVPAIFGMYKLS